MDFKKEVKTVVGHHDVRGINKRFVRADIDTVDTVALRTFVAKAYAVKTDLRTSWTYSAEYTPPVDSHVAFILNMLISWYKAVLWQAGRATGKSRPAENGVCATVVLTRYNYADSHVIVSRLQDEAAKVQVEVDIDEPSFVDPAGDDPVDNFSFNARSPERQEVVLLPSISESAYTWYIKHLVPRRNTTALNFDITVPGVSIANLALRTTSGNDPQYADSSALNWTDAESMWYWLASYVTENRVESHFAMAFELLSALAYRPVADTAEGFLYSTLPTVAHIPQPHYYRARFPGLLEEEPWMVPHDAHDMLLKAGADAHALLAMAGLTNYIAHIGVTATLIEGHLAEPNAKLAAMFAKHAHLHMERPVEHRAGGVFTVIGRETRTHFASGCGVVYPTDQLLSAPRWPFARKTSDDADTYGFDINEAGLSAADRFILPASPALLYGKASEQLTALCHCRPMQVWSLDRGRDTELSVESAYSLANIYRLAGYDTAVSVVQTGDYIKPYSCLSAMSLAFDSFRFNARINTTYMFEGCYPRNPERCLRLPSPEVFFDMGKLNATLTTGHYVMESPDHRGTTITTNYRRARQMKRVEVRIAGGQVLNETIVSKPRPIAHEQQSGFGGEGESNLDAPQETMATAMPE